jgi:hypothetical protein
MKVDGVESIFYPKFTNYIREDIPKLRSHRLIRGALKKYGRMTDLEVETTLGWSSGPIIRTTGLYNELMITNLPFMLAVSSDLVDKFEADSKAKSDSERPALVFNDRRQRLYHVGYSILTTLVYCNVEKVLSKSTGVSSRSIGTASSRATDGFVREVYGKIWF